MTGDVVRETAIREAQDAADEFYGFLRRNDKEPTERRPSTPTLTDAEVVRLAEGARNGAEFSAVYQGGGEFKSGSERDMSLASRIAFWTQDEAQIERIMRGSGCVRDKWDQHRAYLRDTISKALDGLTETYTPAGERTRVTFGGRRASAAGFSVVSGGGRTGNANGPSSRRRHTGAFSGASWSSRRSTRRGTRWRYSPAPSLRSAAP